MQKITKFYVSIFLLLVSIVSNATQPDRVDTTIYSTVLKKSVKISVLIPNSYKYTIEKKFPVIVMLDRQNRNIFDVVVQNIRYLELHSQIPASLIVQVETDFPDRFAFSDHPLARKGGMMPEFRKFINDELLSWTEKHFRINKIRTIIGHSAMGHFTNYLFATSPKTWSCITSMSSFFKTRTFNLLDSISIGEGPPISYYLVQGDPHQDSDQDKIFDSLMFTMPVTVNLRYKKFNYPFANHTAVPGISIGTVLTDFYGVYNKKRINLSQANYNTKGEVPPNEFKTIYDEFVGLYHDSLFLEIGNLAGTAATYEANNKHLSAIKILVSGTKLYPIYYPFYVSIAKQYQKLNDLEKTSSYYITAITILKEFSHLYKDPELLLNSLEKELASISLK